MSSNILHSSFTSYTGIALIRITCCAGTTKQIKHTYFDISVLENKDHMQRDYDLKSQKYDIQQLCCNA